MARKNPQQTKHPATVTWAIHSDLVKKHENLIKGHQNEVKEKLKLQVQIEALGYFIMQQNCGFPKFTEEFPNGMGAVEAAMEYIKELRTQAQRNETLIGSLKEQARLADDRTDCAEIYSIGIAHKLDVLTLIATGQTADAMKKFIEGPPRLGGQRKTVSTVADKASREEDKANIRINGKAEQSETMRRALAAINRFGDSIRGHALQPFEAAELLAHFNQTVSRQVRP